MSNHRHTAVSVRFPPAEILTPGDRFNTFGWAKVDTHKWFASIPGFNLIPKKVSKKIEKDYREDAIEISLNAVKEHLLNCSCVNGKNAVRIDMEFIEHIDEYGTKNKILLTKIKVQEQ